MRDGGREVGAVQMADQAYGWAGCCVSSLTLSSRNFPATSQRWPRWQVDAQDAQKQLTGQNCTFDGATGTLVAVMGSPFQLAVSGAEMNFNSFATRLPLGENTISLRPRQVPGQAGAGLQPGSEAICYYHLSHPFMIPE